MPDLANPFQFVGAQASPTEEAVASHPQTSGDATADFSCIGEIFVGAQKLGYVPNDFDPAAITPADELLFEVLQAMNDPRLPGLPEIPDEQALFEAIEPPPLFLQAVGY